MRRSFLVVLCLVTSFLLFASPAMWTSVVGLNMSFDDCRDRVSDALEAEGYGNFRDFGNGYVAFTDTAAASVGCIRGEGETVLSVVVSGGNDVKARMERLVALVRGGGGRGGRTSEGEAATWSTNAASFRGQRGRRIVFDCPSNGTIGSVWGTDIYTDDSSVCSAAVHAGLITRARGGTVTIEIGGPQSGYRGTLRRGVTSANYGAWDGSFTFGGGTTTRPESRNEAESIPWNTTATPWRGRNGDRFTVSCAAGGTFGSVWGSGIYTDDSSICTAAVHAGLISRQRGGLVTIEILPGRSSYSGSNRNGVASGNYGVWSGSFEFIDD